MVRLRGKRPRIPTAHLEALQITRSTAVQAGWSWCSVLEREPELVQHLLALRLLPQRAGPAAEVWHVATHAARTEKAKTHAPPRSSAATLTWDAGRWVLRDEGAQLAEYSTDDIRVSLQMKVPPGGMLPNILPKPF